MVCSSHRNGMRGEHGEKKKIVLRVTLVLQKIQLAIVWVSLVPRAEIANKKNGRESGLMSPSS